jgi:ribonuclease P protein component
MKKKWIKNIFKEKRIYVNKNICIFYKKIHYNTKKNQNQKYTVRIAISIPKKIIKKSVTRNKTKRLLRVYIKKNYKYINNGIHSNCDMLLIYKNIRQENINNIIKKSFQAINNKLKN